MILVRYATYHLGPGPPEISQFVFKCPDSRIDWSLSTIFPLSIYPSLPPYLSQALYPFLAHHCIMTDLGLWLIYLPALCMVGIFSPFIFYITHHVNCNSTF